MGVLFYYLFYLFQGRQACISGNSLDFCLFSQFMISTFAIVQKILDCMLIFIHGSLSKLNCKFLASKMGLFNTYTLGHTSTDATESSKYWPKNSAQLDFCLLLSLCSFPTCSAMCLNKFFFFKVFFIQHFQIVVSQEGC